MSTASTMSTAKSTAADVLVSSLSEFGIDRVFTVAGESYLGLLDALYDSSVDVVTCRQEGGAGFMALADARMTRLPGVCMVSRGPGASNASISLHAAQQDGVPFLLIVGQVPADHLRSRSFQEIDYVRAYSPMVKRVFEVTDPDLMSSTIAEALHTATSGEPGPVVLVVPEDVLTAKTDNLALRTSSVLSPYPSPDNMQEVRQLLSIAKRPVVIVGSGIEQSPGGREALLAFAEGWNIPVSVSFRRHDLFPGNHPLYAGEVGLITPRSHIDLLNEADLILAIGTRLSDITSQGFTFPDPYRKSQTVVHIYDDPNALVHQCAPEIRITTNPVGALKALGMVDGACPDRSSWIETLVTSRLKTAKLSVSEGPDGIAFSAAVDALLPQLTDDAILSVDAGTLAVPLYKALAIRGQQRLLASTSGAMGVGVPATVSAALRYPDRLVVCLVGDGGLMMTGNELAVALNRRLPVKILLSNNGSYGSIRIHQEKEYPGRTIATDLSNPSFRKWAEAFGCQYFKVNTLDELPVISEWLQSPHPAILEVKTSLSAVLPDELIALTN